MNALDGFPPKLPESGGAPVLTPSVDLFRGLIGWFTCVRLSNSNLRTCSAVLTKGKGASGSPARGRKYRSAGPSD
jgi:hypothetical protein